MMPFTVDDVVFSAQAACVLEASVDKPGNVGPGHDFEDTAYEDFIVSAVSIGPAVKGAVEFGMIFAPGKPGVGNLIKTAVLDSRRRHPGRNTNLGLAMLIIPLSVSAGICMKEDTFTLQHLRKGVGTALQGSTPEDTLDLYDAVIASEAEVGKSDRFDVNDPDSKRRVLEKKLNLYDIFRMSSWDAVAKELVSNMEVSFTLGYPALTREYGRTENLRASVLRCFFEILSSIPDTLIERKNNRETALEITKEAKIILEKGLPEKDVASFDSKLRCDKNRYNPGTTADLTGSSLMIALLDGMLM